MPKLIPHRDYIVVIPDDVLNVERYLHVLS